MTGRLRYASGVVTVLLSAGLSLGAGADGVAAVDLRCDYRTDPLGVNAANPRLGWRLEASRRGVKQTAYRVLAASRAALLAEGTADLWDTGRVESSSSQGVRYEGTAVPGGAQVFWKVRVWDEGGKPSGWAAQARWTRALGPEEWTARWICASRAAAPPAEGLRWIWHTDRPPLPIFRREFTVGQEVRRAVVSVCGLGHYELRLNGGRVGDRALDPGWTNYRATCLYAMYDVTAELSEGANAFGLLLGNGMYNVTGGRYVKFTGSFGPPTAILQLDIEYDGGSRQRVVTDGAWRWSEGPITFSCIYGGEDYDARREQPGWDRAGFDDRAWKSAAVAGGPGGVLRCQEAPPVIAKRRIRPVAVIPAGEGDVYDLGDNFAGRPVIRVRGQAGSAVTITPAERVTEGEPRLIGNFGHTYTYTLKGEGEERWTPRFTYYGQRYLLVERRSAAGGTPPEVLEVAADYLTSAAPRIGSFACSNALFNRIEGMIDWSVGSNLQSVLTDCPHREKLGWLEVAHLMGPSILYRYDTATFYRKVARDTRESQEPNGHVPTTAPRYTTFQGGFHESAEWGSACVLIPWLLYRWYEDRDALEDQYDTMKRYVRYLEASSDASGLAKPGLGDWYEWSPEKGHEGASTQTPPAFTATAMHYRDAVILSRTARLLGREEEAAAFEEQAARVRRAFAAAYWHPETSTFAKGSQTSQAMALRFDLVEDSRRASVVERLVENVRSTGNRQTSGEVGFRFLVLALAEAGRSDVVFDMVNRTDAPGYGCLLSQGLQTLSERWDRPGSSLNHCMFGHIQEWFTAYVAGIRQARGSVGFREIVIAPAVVGDLTWARGQYDSLYGRIRSAWRLDGAELTLEVSVPPNTSATVVVPTSASARVTVGGVPADRAEQVTVLRREADRVVFAVPSGAYGFRAEYERGCAGDQQRGGAGGLLRRHSTRCIMGLLGVFSGPERVAGLVEVLPNGKTP